VWRISETPPGLYPDEAMNGNNALEALHTGNFKTFYPENNGREGLFINIQAMSVALFGNKPWALRLMSSLFGVFTVLGVYFLTKELFRDKFQTLNFKSQNYIFKFKKLKQNLETNEIVALLASFFLATSFWHINFSRIGFRAIMAPFFLTWSLYFLLLSFRKMVFFEEENNLENLKLNLTSKFKKLKYKILNITVNKWQIKFGNFAGIAGIIYGLGFHSYIAYRATPVLIILIFVYFWFKQKENRRKILFNGFFFLFFFFMTISPLLFYFINNPQDFLGRTSQISVFSSVNPIKDLFINTAKTVGMFWYQGDLNSRHNLSGKPQLWWPVGILFAAGILICLFRIFKNKNILPHLLLLSWLIVGLLPVIVSNEGIPHALRAIIVLPAVMIISGIALYKIIFKTHNWLTRQEEKFPDMIVKIKRIQKESLVLLFFFFITVAIFTFNQYFFRFALSPYVYDAFSADYVRQGNYLNSLPKNMKKYVVVNASGTDVRGLPMPTQTVMFITKTFLPQWQKEKNMHYVLFQNLNEISCENSCVITMLSNDGMLRKQLKEQIKNLELDSSPGFVVLKNFKN